MLEILLSVLLLLLIIALLIALAPFLLVGATIVFCLIMALCCWVKEKFTP